MFPGDKLWKKMPRLGGRARTREDLDRGKEMEYNVIIFNLKIIAN